jgi:predicted nucleotidyltransferase
MRELMKEGRVDTGIVLKRLKVEDADVMCVYLIGSRLWGSASDGSDWDFEIVHRSWKEGSGRSSLHNGELDASMIDKYAFLE